MIRQKKYRDRNEAPLEEVKSVMDKLVMKIGGAEEVRHFNSVVEGGLKIATPRMEKEAQPFMTSQSDCSRVMANIRAGYLDFMTINKREVAIIWGTPKNKDAAIKATMQNGVNVPETPTLDLRGFEAELEKTKTPTPAAPTVGPSRFQEAYDNQLEQEHRRAIEMLSMRYPDWRKIINGKDNTGKDARGNPTAYRAWLAKQPPEYQAKILGSWNPSEVANAIDKFKKETK